MDTSVILMILAGVATLAFFFFIYLSAKVFNWLHLTAIILLYISIFPALLFTASAGKTRINWVEATDKINKEIAEQEKQIEAERDGNPTDAKRPSMSTLRTNLVRVTVDRGQVWRDCTPAIVGGALTVTIPTQADQSAAAPAVGAPADPAAAPPAVVPHNIKPSTILYVFRQKEMDGIVAGTKELAYYYIGSFKVASATDTTITIAAMQLQDEKQAAEMQAGGLWTLYDTSPADSHEAFTEDLAKLPDDAAKAARVQQLFPLADLAIDQASYDKFVQSYVRDMQKATDSDPSEVVYHKVKFAKPFEMQVDAPEAISPFQEARFFNQQGQAVTGRLMRASFGADGKPVAAEGIVKFKAGDECILDDVTVKGSAQLSITGLEESGTVQVVEKLYVRKLTDFALEIAMLEQSKLVIEERKAIIARDLATAKAAEESAKEQIAVIDEAMRRVNEDKTKVDDELAKLQAYAKKLEEQFSKTRTTLATLYNQNHSLREKLIEINAKLTEAIENKSRPAETASR